MMKLFKKQDPNYAAFVHLWLIYMDLFKKEFDHELFSSEEWIKEAVTYISRTDKYPEFRTMDMICALMNYVVNDQPTNSTGASTATNSAREPNVLKHLRFPRLFGVKQPESIKENITSETPIYSIIDQLDKDIALVSTKTKQDSSYWKGLYSRINQILNNLTMDRQHFYDLTDLIAKTSSRPSSDLLTHLKTFYDRVLDQILLKLQQLISKDKLLAAGNIIMGILQSVITKERLKQSVRNFISQLEPITTNHFLPEDEVSRLYKFYHLCQEYIQKASKYEEEMLKLSNSLSDAHRHIKLHTGLINDLTDYRAKLLAVPGDNSKLDITILDNKIAQTKTLRDQLIGQLINRFKQNNRAQVSSYIISKKLTIPNGVVLEPERPVWGSIKIDNGIPVVQWGPSILIQDD